MYRFFGSSPSVPLVPCAGDGLVVDGVPLAGPGQAVVQVVP